ncbi:Competence protein ComEA helix-hairpin-helix repeat protein [Microbacterium sp. C448]|uniref:ComEA family DNA-binding protein n=1 Tax=Microbacterium sp. C448 TaxID=1177594 RepID=UPI0003DE5176|nr:ComEA family DNA-binding protein [Microbacterium sp. C448]CDJ99978.1 Competence protein ComEA helix-hairpin-helix repeat protein [Microbacterium sp. C448]
MARDNPPNSAADDSSPDGPGDAYARASPRARAMVGAVVVVLLVALGITVVVGIVQSGTSSPEVVPLEEASGVAGEDVSAGVLYVHVSGAVARPGLYRLDGGARLVDAVAVAGGFAEDADEAGVNLARTLSDGEQIVVPVVGQAPPAASAGGGTTGDARVNLNTATVAELDTLPRVGPAIAQRIIDWRTTNGRFSAVDDLLSVPGIGEKMLESLRPLVVL